MAGSLLKVDQRAKHGDDGGMGYFSTNDKFSPFLQLIAHLHRKAPAITLGR
jgi:hypothetical protein